MPKIATLVAFLLVLGPIRIFAGTPVLLIPGSFPGEGPWKGDLSGEWVAFLPDPPRIVATRLVSGPGKSVCDPRIPTTRIKAPDATNALFIVRGLPQLKPGAVATAYSGYKFLYPGETQTILMGPAAWRLRAFGTAASPNPGEVLFTNYEVQIAGRSGPFELVFKLDALSDDAAPHVIWAGDLDGDQNLDLFAELRTNYCVSSKALFLSSASQGRLAPARVGTLESGCC